MNLAAMDIGTNSVRLLVSSCGRGRFKTLYRTMHITRIGQDLGRNKTISVAAAQRTLNVLKKYRQALDQYRVKQYRAVGTNALRVAKNGKWFTALASQKVGLDIEIISGKQEADLSFAGAAKGLQLSKIKGMGDLEKVMVLDIGGGSTEIIIGSPKKPEHTVSTALGCVTLTEKFGDDTEKIEAYAADSLKSSVHNLKRSGLTMVGLAGTITTIAAIDLGLDKYDRDRIHHHRLGKKNIETIYERLKGLDLGERKKVRGLDPERADIIVAGTAILLSVLDYFNIEEIMVSEEDILDGIIYSLSDFW